MRNETSSIYLRSANPGAASMPAAPKLFEGGCEERASLTERRLQQKAAGSKAILQL
jgi:hypothetical protein